MSLTLFLGSAIALGRAIQIGNGFFAPGAMTWLLAGLLLCAAGTLLLRLDRRFTSMTSLPGPQATIAALAGAGIAWQLYQLYVSQPGFDLAFVENVTGVRIGVVALAVCTAAGLSRLRRFERVWFGGVLAASVGLGIWMIKAAPVPIIDVLDVHHAAIDALLSHKDPYRVWIPNVYGDLASVLYNPKLISGRYVMIGYPYPPVSLLLAVPGQVLFGDYRYAELAAAVGAAALIGFSSRGLMPKLAATLFLTTPRHLFVLQQGWTEPIAVLLLATTVFVLIRKPALVPWAAGLLMVTKQYLALAAPAYLRFVIGTRPKDHRPQMLIVAACVGLLATVPFAVWHPVSFFDNVVWLQTKEPFRPDSLSLLSWAAAKGWGHGTFVWAVGAASVALAFALVATPNTAAGFSAAVAFSTFVMFAFGSKAFCNYYYFVIGALCCTAAALAALDTRRASPG